MSVETALIRLSGRTPDAAADDVSVGRIQMFGTQARIAYQRDEDEWRRRQGDTSPILALDALDILMDLPVGIPVPAAELAPANQRLLRRLPPGSLDWSATAVTRQVRPPLMPILATVCPTRWLDGLRAASRFAAYCPRLVIVSSMPTAPDALTEAAVYGIGVAVADGTGDLQVVVEPEPLHDWQPTPAWWWFTEEIYRQVRFDT